jgi:hypothetical protein
MFELKALCTLIMISLIMKLMWLFGGTYVGSHYVHVCSQSLTIQLGSFLSIFTCYFCSAPWNHIWRSTHNKQAQKIVQVKHLPHRGSSFLLSHEKKTVHGTHTYTLSIGCLDIICINCTLYTSEKQYKIDYVRFVPIIIVSFQTYHNFYGSWSMGNQCLAIR